MWCVTEVNVFFTNATTFLPCHQTSAGEHQKHDGADDDVDHAALQAAAQRLLTILVVIAAAAFGDLPQLSGMAGDDSGRPDMDDE